LINRDILSKSRNLIFDIIHNDMEALDGLIRQKLDSDVALVQSIADYIISSGGKRIRPGLVLLSAGACGYEGAVRLDLAAVVEFIHTATLLHDDVVDDSEFRRGRKTANTEFGNAASVLVGDFLYSRAFQMMLVAGNMRVMEVLAAATNTIAAGEVLQLMNTHNAEIGETEYFDVIRRKTAKLFEAAAQLGAILGGATMEVELGLARYGAHLGTAFQLIDDVLDYSGEPATTGKNIGDDLSEGKATLPLIYVLKHGEAQHIAVVRAAIESGGRSDLSMVRDAIASCGALDYARSAAFNEAELARQSISAMPESAFKDSLLELTSFAVERIY
jgi:octaprenyl-diphosphate synthase